MARGGNKRAEQVAAQIEADIAALGWPVGHNLGSEAALIERYGVSRAVLREAVRLIEHHLVGRMRPGPGGGLVVTEQNPDVVARAMSLYLAFAQVSRQQLLEVRSEIEGFAAELAAARASDQERVELREYMRDEPDALEKSWLHAKEFHLKVAALAHNPTISLFVRCLVDLTEDRTEPEKDRSAVIDHIHAIHDKICQAIIAGDGGMARFRMKRHIHAISPWLTGDEAGPA